MNIKLFCLFTLMFFSQKSFGQLEYSKIEYPGCPDNAFCTKETGVTRQTWRDDLLKLKNNQKENYKILKKYQSEIGILISLWATEDARILPNISLWDSQCAQHKRGAQSFYIGDFFMKSLNDKELSTHSNLFVTRAYRSLFDGKVIAQKVPREDNIPYYISNKGFHYLKSDEGPFYGLIISREGDLTLLAVDDFMKQKNAQMISPMSDAICTVEQINLLKKESPYPDFYKSYICKNIWNIDSNKYENVIFGRGCE